MEHGGGGGCRTENFAISGLKGDLRELKYLAKGSYGAPTGREKGVLVRQTSISSFQATPGLNLAK